MKFLYIEIILALFAAFVYCDCNSFKATFEDAEVSCNENKNGDIINLEYNGLVTPEVLEAFGSLSSIQSLYIYVKSTNLEIDLSPLHKLKKLEKLEFECRVHKVRTVSYGFVNNSLGGFENLKTLILYGFSLYLYC